MATILHSKIPYSEYAQDQGLDIISEGLDTLKNLANDMNEVGLWILLLHMEYCPKKIDIYQLLWFFQELDRQVPLIDEIDTKVWNFSWNPKCGTLFSLIIFE